MAIQVETQKNDIVTITDFKIDRDALVDPYQTLWIIKGRLAFSYEDSFINLGVYTDTEKALIEIYKLDKLILQSKAKGETLKHKMEKNL